MPESDVSMAIMLVPSVESSPQIYCASIIVGPGYDLKTVYTEWFFYRILTRLTQLLKRRKTPTHTSVIKYSMAEED